MNRKLEDNLGKLAMLLFFGYVAVQQLIAVIAILIHRADIPMWQLALTSRVAGTTFMILIVYFTFTRLPPRGIASGLEPRLTAIAGTFIMNVLIILPPGSIGVELQIISTLLVIVGTALSAYCIRQLGRSFSIMATARELVTEGPYKIIRHPLYGAELVAVLGVVLGHWSPGAAVLGLVWLALQIKRAQNEERILRENFPEYGDYARRVPMLLPGFILPNFSRA